jgi:serine/threonine-protein kinase
MSGVDKREAFPPGTLVGERFRVVSALARGGFGAVYVAEQLATARLVALKLMTLHVSDVSVDRLLDEARLTSRVNSEHIVQVYDAGIDRESSLVFVAMELLSGTNLAELVRNHGPRSAGETAEYLRQVALGLDRAHGLVTSDGRPTPIVHRDLKPANLFLTRREDGTAWIKILDFGAAKILSDDVQSSGVVRGTPEYMAYEQAAGGDVTRATDVWAFGLVAFTLLAGRAYWRGAQSDSGRAQVFGEILSLPLERASERAKQIGAPAVFGPAFDAWFSRCVNRDASERYASAGDAARELARALEVTVRPVQVPWLDRIPTASDVGTAATAAKSSSLSVKDPSGVAASSRAARAPRSFSLAVAILLAVLAAAVLFWWSRAGTPEAGSIRRPSAGSRVAPPASALAPVPSELAPRAVPQGSSTVASTSSSVVPPAPASASPRPSAGRVLSGTRHPSVSSSTSASAPPSANAGSAPPQRADPYDLR